MRQTIEIIHVLLAVPVAQSRMVNLGSGIYIYCPKQEAKQQEEAAGTGEDLCHPSRARSPNSTIYILLYRLVIRLHHQTFVCC